MRTLGSSYHHPNTKPGMLFLAALWLLCGPWTAAGQRYPADIQKIIDQEKLVVAMVANDQPPFFKADKKGRLEGFDVELAKGIAQELGVQPVFDRSAKTFNQTVDMLVAGEADIVVSKLSRTLPRSKRVLFTEPYITLRKGLLVNRLRLAQASKGIKTTDFIRHLKGEIGVVAGSSYVEFAKQMFPLANLRTFPTWKAVVDAVSRGSILAAFRDELELKKVIRQQSNSILKLQTIVFKDTKDPIAIAVSNESPQLHFWLNQYLDSKNIVTDVDALLDRFQYMFAE